MPNRLKLALLLLPATAVVFHPMTALAKDPPRIEAKEKKADKAENAEDAKQAPATVDEAAGDLRAEPIQPAKKTEAERKKEAEENKKQKELTEAERLEKIVLPENPTRKQCEDYVAALRRHVEGRNSFASSHKEVDKLKAIPAEHIDLLLTEMSNHSNLQFYARYSLRDIQVDEHKDKIVAKLDEQPNNILFVVHYGWFDAAKPTILARLKSTEPSSEIEPAWFQAFVEVAEPEHYDKLHELAVKSREITKLMPLLESLPSYDLSHTINEAWKPGKANEHDYYLRRKRESLAPYAASIGNVEALGMLVNKLQDAPSYRMRLDYVNQERLNITRFIDFRGSDKQIADWYKANKDDLIFDVYRKKFVLPED